MNKTLKKLVAEPGKPVDKEPVKTPWGDLDSATWGDLDSADEKDKWFVKGSTTVALTDKKIETISTVCIGDDYGYTGRHHTTTCGRYFW